MDKITLREPAVAGQFYPSSAAAIKKQLASFLEKQVTPEDCIACMMPHAGYIYSGKVATQTASRVQSKDSVILLGPNHTGYGAPFSIMKEGRWKTPLGAVSVDSELADAILTDSTLLQHDPTSHAYEHSLEVELPILQYFKQDFQIVPIVFLADDLHKLKVIGKNLARSIEKSGKKDSILIVASSDMTHYETLEEATRKDNEAIQAILTLNEDALIELSNRLNISMCGYAPAVVMIVCAKLLGATKAKLIAYETSAEVSKDTSSVVGYAGITIQK